VHAAEWHSNRQWVRRAKTVLAFAVIYFCADLAINRFAFRDVWTIIWPLNGINVALLLMRPRSQWLWVLLGIEIGTGVGECVDDFSPWLEVGKRLCSAAEVLIIALLLPPFTSLDGWLRTPRVFVRFFAGLILGPGISGIIYAVLYHYLRDQPLLLAFNNWATADALGVLATMPLALSLSSPQMRSLFQREALPKTLGLLTLSLAGAELIFSVSSYSLLFLLYPLLLLVDSMLAFAGSSIAVVACCSSRHTPSAIRSVRSVDGPRNLPCRAIWRCKFISAFTCSPSSPPRSCSWNAGAWRKSSKTRMRAWPSSPRSTD